MTLTCIKPGLHAVGADAGDLPVHPRLRHPVTGAPIQALGYRRDGRAIWPVIGGDGTGDPPKPADPPADPPKPPGDPAKPAADPKPGDPAKDEPLGPAGLKALQAERDAREKLEKEFAPLRPLLTVLGGAGGQGDGKTELDKLNERFAAQEKALAEERRARWVAEVQAEKKLTPAQAKRLSGATKEELLADADDLIAAFPAPADPDPKGGRGAGRPKPDPAQGASGDQKLSSLDGGRTLYAQRHKRKSTTAST